jgi:hypothetical protein
MTTNLVERSFRVEGPEGLGAQPRPELVGPLLTNLPVCLLDAVRMGFRHSSHARGRVPAALKAAADVRFLGHGGDGDGVTLLHFAAPSFESVAADLFRQGKLWDDGPKPDETAFELFGAALTDVSARREDSDAFDRGLLHRIHWYRRVLSRGIDRIGMPDTMAPKRGTIDATAVDAARDLMAATPSPRRVRIVGRLDVMGVSQGVLKLEVQPGQIITALWDGDEPIDSFRGHLNADVALEGLGVFRPSGTLLRIDADAIAPASSQDDFFRRVPFAPVLRDIQKRVRVRAGDKSAYARILGIIPPEESDEEFAAAVDALS